MSINREEGSPVNDSLLRHSALSASVAGTLVLSLVVLLLTYLFGGFEGLTGAGAGALIFGVLASFGLGIGLMALVFQSSHGYDDTAHYAAMDYFKNEAAPLDKAKSPPPV